MSLSMKFVEAVAFASDAHAGQVRKGTQIPYISHPLAVATLVLEFGGSEELAIAGLLHDVVEDCNPVYGNAIADVFGGRVAAIVLKLTDGVVGADGKKPEWRERKEKYIARLKDAGPDVLLVKACDAIHNASATLEDLKRDGLQAFERFRGGVDGTLWYYLEVAKACRSTAAGVKIWQVYTDMAKIVEGLKTDQLRCVIFYGGRDE